MQAEQIITKITQAFSSVQDATWTGSEELDASDALDIARDIFCLADDAKKFFLPKIMCAAIRNPKEPILSKLLCETVLILDVRFYGLGKPNTAFHKSKLKIFSDYTYEQQKAILSWLEYVRDNYSLEYDKLSLSSAIHYWNRRVERTKINEPTSQP